jgi:hypothetical protein
MRVRADRTSDTSDERSRGAVALVAALSLVSIFGFTALTVDLGNNWQHRRGLINATDAAALAAAQEYALGGVGCDALAATYVASNRSDATMTQCQPSPSASGGVTGSVTVAAETLVEYVFAPVIGFEEKVITSSTTAQFGRPVSLFGLRPFGLCEDVLDVIPEYQTFLSNPAAYAALADTDENKIARITYGKDDPSHCNAGASVPGNWAFIDFNGGANSAAETGEWVQDGFDGQISRDSDHLGDTGAFGIDLNQELKYLVDNQVQFGLPLFDSASDVGSNAVFHISGFIAVEVVGFKATGAQAGRYLDVIFKKAIMTGVCCEVGDDPDRQIRVVQICATDATDSAGCRS